MKNRMKCAIPGVLESGEPSSVARFQYLQFSRFCLRENATFPTDEDAVLLLYFMAYAEVHGG